MQSKARPCSWRCVPTLYPAPVPAGGLAAHPTVPTAPELPQVQLRRDIIMSLSSPGLHGAPDSRASAPGCSWNCNSFFHSWRGADTSNTHKRHHSHSKGSGHCRCECSAVRNPRTAQQTPVCPGKRLWSSHSLPT